MTGNLHENQLRGGRSLFLLIIPGYICRCKEVKAGTSNSYHIMHACSQEQTETDARLLARAELDLSILIQFRIPA